MNISHLCTWPLPSKTVNTGKLSPLPPTRMWIDPPASNSHKWRSIGINNPGAACYLLLVGYIDPNTPKSSKKLEEQDSHLTGKCCDVTKKTSRFGGYDISHKKNTWEIRKIRFTKCSTTGVRISNIYIYIWVAELDGETHVDDAATQWLITVSFRKHLQFPRTTPFLCLQQQKCLWIVQTTWKVDSA